jgi:uncharacterized protein (TIGR00369 family)
MQSMESEELFRRGQNVLLAQPFSRLLGAELMQLTEGVAEIQIAIRPDFLQQHGVVHGGVISYLADNALTFAGGSLLGDAVTLEFKVNYLRAAKNGRLVAKASVVSGTRNIAICRCEVFEVNDTDTNLCAVAQGTIWKKN